MLKIKQTPWGTADYVQMVKEGIYKVGTPSHGGYKLDRERNNQMPKHMRNPGGWYEEDCEWSKVALVFPEIYPEHERESKIERAQGVYESWCK